MSISSYGRKSAIGSRSLAPCKNFWTALWACRTSRGTIGTTGLRDLNNRCSDMTLGCDKIEGKQAVSWTIEFGQKTPKDGRWNIMTVHSEAEAVRQAKEYLDIGF